MSKDTRDHRLQIRITEDEKERLRLAAQRSRRTLSNFVIASALEKADELLGKERGGA
ncbi:MAG: DUF1778 domain-containing protein [Alphaproteobacteria bacterium]|nr:MAG: DUF1778 domain-containing protein [Alphaproteobacteria bacterium]